MTSKRSYLLIFVLLAGLALAQNQNMKVLQEDEVFKLYQDFFTSSETYSTEFREIAGGIFRRGKLYFRAPSDLVVIYYDRNGNFNQRISINSETMYVYLPAINIVIEQALKIGQNEDEKALTASKVHQLHRLSKSYNFSFLESREQVPVLDDESKKDFNMAASYQQYAYRMLATPREITEGLQSIELYINKEGQLIRSRSTTVEGRVLDLLFTSYEKNKLIPEKVFEFETPANAQVIEDLFQARDIVEDNNETQEP